MTDPNDASPSGGRITVLHITGTGRSGSTLIARLLGSLPGAFAAGEVRFLWERGLSPESHCGCRRPVRECPVWSGVVARIDPDADHDAAMAFHRRLYEATRLRQAARRLLRRSDLDADEQAVADELLEAYRAIRDESGATVVVDSSKLPNYAALLDTIPEIDLRVLHLVRDPRAAAWSWMRGSASMQVAGFEEKMDQMSSVKSSLLWSTWNGLTARHFGGRRHRGRYLRVRYEDIMSDPRRVSEQIARFAGLDPSALPFTDDTHAQLAATHIVAGNPNRVGEGPVAFSLDRRWESAMSTRDKATVVALTGPLLLRFGYSWKS